MKPTLPLALTLAALTGCASHQAMHSGYPADEPEHHAMTEADHHPTTDLAAAQDAQPLAGQPTYSSPEEAVNALREASIHKDLQAIARIIGLPPEDLITPDQARNISIAEFFSREYDAAHTIAMDGDSRANVFIGKDNFALASPLIRLDNRWFFDSAGGKQALFDRYIDDNQAATIGVCRAYVQAQYEYYAEDRNGDNLLEYAQHLASTKGTHDGLYWHSGASSGEPESPLGPLIASARASGYLKGSARTLDEPRPYHGYVFRILTRQGEHAPGGAHDYIINGHMVAGFALLAYPARYAKSGTLTFLVGANGMVLEKDLGAGTAEAAASIDAYDPDSSWRLAE